MSANTEMTGAACKAPDWCGKLWMDLSMAQRSRWHETGTSWRGDNIPVYCSPECRHTRPSPIAAPAANVEQRKGQRWRMRSVNLGADFSGVLAEDAGATWKLSDVVAMDGKGTDRRFRADMWTTPDTTMALLADATPEPAKRRQKALACDHCQAMQEVETDCDAVMCAVCFAAGHSLRDKSPPAQEAPKAAPVAVCIDCDTAPIDRPVPMRFFGRVGHARPICDECYQEREKYIGEGAGTPYAGPERLPKPHLAADWAEDCLPESGR